MGRLGRIFSDQSGPMGARGRDHAKEECHFRHWWTEQ